MRETGKKASSSLEDSGYVSGEFTIVESVARIVSSVYGAKPDYTRLQHF